MRKYPVSTVIYLIKGSSLVPGEASSDVQKVEVEAQRGGKLEDGASSGDGCVEHGGVTAPRPHVETKRDKTPNINVLFLI